MVLAMLRTSRLILRHWQDADRDPFAAMNADPEVMADLGGPFDRARSDAKFDRYRAAQDKHGISRWVVQDVASRFLGYTGILHVGPDHPLGAHAEIGWRLVRAAWGHGYASEAAKAALEDGFARVGLKEVLSYTAPDNLRSQAVMERVGLQRDEARDFDWPQSGTVWRGLVWFGRPTP